MQALARRAAAPVFALAMFSSAALIFVLQPLFARMVTPLLGGSPAVWNTSMAFFQAALLAGYGYTHSSTTYLPVRKQILLQAALLLLPLVCFVLPFSIGNWQPPMQADAMASRARSTLPKAHPFTALPHSRSDWSRLRRIG